MGAFNGVLRKKRFWVTLRRSSSSSSWVVFRSIFTQGILYDFFCAGKRKLGELAVSALRRFFEKCYHDYAR